MCMRMFTHTHNSCVHSVGMVFMPNDDALEAQSKAIYEAAIAKEGMQLLGWRQVCVYVCVCVCVCKACL